MTDQNSARYELRKAIFASREMERHKATFQGMAIELKQPTIQQIQELDTDPKTRFVRMLMEFAYVPGTEDRVFESGDFDVLLGLPYTPEIMKIQEIMTGFFQSDVKAEEKN